MTVPLAVSALLAVAVVVAALRRRFSDRQDNTPLGLGVRPPQPAARKSTGKLDGRD